MYKIMLALACYFLCSYNGVAKTFYNIHPTFHIGMFDMLKEKGSYMPTFYNGYFLAYGSNVGQIPILLTY